MNQLHVDFLFVRFESYEHGYTKPTNAAKKIDPKGWDHVAIRVRFTCHGPWDHVMASFFPKITVEVP